MQKYKIESYGSLNGYITIYVPSYPRPTSSNYDGWQYEHVFIKELELGRFLNSNECVHHLDGNRGNNHPSNLILMTKADHARIHKWISMGKVHEVISEKVFRCIICDAVVLGKKNKYCSKKCVNAAYTTRKVNTVGLTLNKEILIDLLTEHKNFLEVGKKFNISDNAIRKWCKKFGIPSSSSYWRNLNKKAHTPAKYHKLTPEEITQVQQYFALHKSSRPYSVRELAKLLDVHHTTLYDISTKVSHQ